LIDLRTSLAVFMNTPYVYWSCLMAVVMVRPDTAIVIRLVVNVRS
jgi:hypothetical protein